MSDSGRDEPSEEPPFDCGEWDTADGDSSACTIGHCSGNNSGNLSLRILEFVVRHDGQRCLHPGLSSARNEHCLLCHCPRMRQNLSLRDLMADGPDAAYPSIRSFCMPLQSSGAARAAGEGGIFHQNH